MTKYKIAWLPGDGIGNDVMEAVKIVLDAIKLDAEFIHGDVGWEFWCSEGNPLPDRTVDLLRKTDCCLFGAITSKPKEEAEKELAPELKKKGYVYFSPIVRLRQEFSLAVNLRPCKAYKGNPLNYKDDIDLVVFRENTEDMYAGIEYHPVPERVLSTLKEHPKMQRFSHISPDDMAISVRLITRQATQRIIRAAFDYAGDKGYKSVTVVEKPNVLRETSGLVVREARKIAKEYPDIELWETNIDAMCMWLLKNPQDYGVLVTTNMFGDIVSDLCAQLVGGLGFGASANIGKDYALFEPTHGSAPKYAGQYKVNPLAMLITTRLMLDYLEENVKADLLESAIANVIAAGKARTYDMGGSSSTLEVAHTIANEIHTLERENG
ncbi:isocitrate/isopropylmalate dehydrogenase family protein [candidate division KSB1 bacterium]|nr:isocitrate/isopropylmalate dehydrogenase family protein [candidate division KSB1 bacterium]